MLDESAEGNGEVVNTADEELEGEDVDDTGGTVPDSSPVEDLVELTKVPDEVLEVDVTSVEENELPVWLDSTGTVCAVTNVVVGNDTVIVKTVWLREVSVVDDTSVCVDE